MFDIAVVGAIGIDTNIYLPGREIDFKVEANFTRNLDMVGQSGAYCAQGYARLGKKTVLIDTVGEDYHGEYIRQTLQQQGVDLQGLMIDTTGTRRSINIMYPDGRRKNFYDGRGHLTFQPDMKRMVNILKQCRAAHFSVLNWARYLLKPARDLKIPIACDLQDLTDINDPYRRDFIEAADILFFSGANFPDMKPVLKTLLHFKPDLLALIGLGARGCALVNQRKITWFPPFEPPFPVIDTNGAGDGLAVGFITSYWMDGYSIEDSARRGQISARYTCGLQGETARLIDTQTLDQFFNHYPRFSDDPVSETIDV